MSTFIWQFLKLLIKIQLNLIGQERVSYFILVSFEKFHVAIFNFSHKSLKKENEQATMLASYFYGHLSFMMFGGSLVARFGPKPMAVGGTVLAGIASLIYPWTVKFSFILACILRVIMGAAHALLMPALQAILIPWSPHHEMARFFFAQGSGVFVGTVGSFYVGGLFIQRYGWENLFIFGGLASVVTGVIYYFVVESMPENSKFVSEDEVAYIKEHRLKFKAKVTSGIPYKNMLTSGPVWSVNIAFATFFTVHTFFANLMPKYLNDSLNVDFNKAGKLSAIPTGVELFFAGSSTFIADALLKRGMTVKTLRRGIMVIAQLIPGVLCLVLTQLTSLPWIITVSSLTLAINGIQPSGQDFYFERFKPIN